MTSNFTTNLLSKAITFLASVVIAFNLVGCKVEPVDRSATWTAPRQVDERYQVPPELALVFTPMLPVNAPVPPMDGQVYALQAGTTLRGIKDCLKAAPLTKILLKGENVLFVWRLGESGWAFVGINGRTGIPARWWTQGELGNLANGRDMSDLLRVLVASGWKYITPGAVPAAITDAIQTASFAVLSRSLLVVAYLPAAMLERLETITAPRELTD